MPKDDEAKIREEQQKQQDEQQKQEEERKKQREAAAKRMEESVPTPSQEENDEAVTRSLHGGVEAKRSTEAAPPSGTYSTRTANPTPPQQPASKKERE